jgi:hypothetical protein
MEEASTRLGEPNMKKRDFLKTTGAALGGAAITGIAGGTTMAQNPLVSEREWARVLARHVAEQLPEAILQVPNVDLSGDQIEEIRRAFENTLVTNMGCETPPTDR